MTFTAYTLAEARALAAELHSWALAGAGNVQSAPIRKGQRVLVSYGAVKVMQAHGKLAVSGYVAKRVPRRPDWYEIDLSVGTVDVGERLVTAHRSALTVLA